MPNRTLFEGGVHLVDLLLALHGEPPEAVYARHSAGLEPERDADAVHLVTLEFPGGRLAQLTIDRLCKAGTRYIELRADCEHASLRASHGGRALLQAGIKRAAAPGDPSPRAGSAALPGSSRGRAARHSRATRATRASPPPAPCSARSWPHFERARSRPRARARRATRSRVIEAAYRSAATGRRVVL